MNNLLGWQAELFSSRQVFSRGLEYVLQYVLEKALKAV